MRIVRSKHKLKKRFYIITNDGYILEINKEKYDRFNVGQAIIFSEENEEQESEKIFKGEKDGI